METVVVHYFCSSPLPRHMERVYFPASLVARCGYVTGHLSVEYEYKWLEEHLPFLLRRISLAQDSLPLPHYLASWNGDDQSNPVSQLLVVELIPAWVSSDWLEQSCLLGWKTWTVTWETHKLIILWDTEFWGLPSYSSLAYSIMLLQKLLYKVSSYKVFYLIYWIIKLYKQ